MSKWILKDDTALMNWEFWEGDDKQDSAQGYVREFVIGGDAASAHERQYSITRDVAEKICRGLNLTERYTAAFMKEKYKAGFEPVAPFTATEDTIINEKRLTTGISDLIFSTPGCCTCDKTFGERIKIYGMGDQQVGLVCGTCVAKYDLAKASSNSTEALEILYELVNCIEGTRTMSQLRATLNILIKIGLPK